MMKLVSDLTRDLTVRQAQEDVEKLLEEWGKKWTRIDDHYYLFTHLSEETGELARDIINAELNLSNRRTGEPIPRKEAIARIEDDLGDVLYHLIQLANAYDIDLAEAFEKAMTSIKKRYGIQ
jgi:NTP pyrophosphatase (non-canonical NTP hydrolase)